MRKMSSVLARASCAFALAGLMAGCVSIGSEPPPSLLTLQAQSMASPGATRTSEAREALAVMTPDAARKIDALRVPVQVSDSSIAYLKDAVWVEKPARLFQRVVAETIRARGDRLVVDSGDLQYEASTRLSGQLLEMGFDAPSGSVIIRYDAVLRTAGGEVRTQRFETRVPGVAPDVAAVGPALNQAANLIAAEVADWVG